MPREVRRRKEKHKKNDSEMEGRNIKESPEKGTE
jgi:hypothetical protein